MIDPKGLRVIPSTIEDDYLFCEQYQYVIPLYQREYAWGAKEIKKLLNDVNGLDVKSCSNYYLGFISVIQRDSGEIEVIDGQQRLTTLYLIIKALRSNTNGDIKNIPLPGNILTFEGREDKSDYSLKNLSEPDDGCDEGIVKGYKIVSSWLSGMDDINGFIDKLRRVIIFIIPMPLNTDLCKYFISLNNSGRQLAATDVLKARLISKLPQEYHKIFSIVWELCSNMDVYLQRALSVDKMKILFDCGGCLNCCPDHIKWRRVDDCCQKSPTLSEIIESCDDNELMRKGEFEGDENCQYRSILNFPTFLMHVLKLCALENSLTERNNMEIFGSILWGTDDKRLLSFFDDHWEEGMNLADTSGLDNIGGEVKQEETEAVKKFAEKMLIVRFVYDGWVLRRWKRDDEEDFVWTIKHLKHSSRGGWKYRNSFSDANEINEEEDEVRSWTKLRDCILMMQSCLYVTHNSLASMPWITYLLHELCTICRENNATPDRFGGRVLDCLENIARTEVLEKIKSAKNNIWNQGVKTPKILFNFLDYLLWRDGLVCGNAEQRKTFRFIFLDSVEHWYPQSDSSNWKDPGVDIFGNLFLLNIGDNSRLSNLDPKTKKNELMKRKVDRKYVVSLKAIDMMNYTDEDWRGEYKSLEDKHKQYLENARLYSEVKMEP